MTVPGTSASPSTFSPSATPPSTTPPSADAAGYLRVTVGGLVGAVVLMAVGIGIGGALMEIYEDPDGGMANLGLLLFPVGLGALGVLAGMGLGVRTALRRIGDADAARTAWLTVPLAVVCLAMLAVAGLGALLMLGVPIVARRIALRTSEHVQG